MRLFSRHRGLVHRVYHRLHIPHHHRDAFRRRFFLSIVAIAGLIISLSVVKLSLDLRDKAQKETLGQPQTVILEFEQDSQTDQITLINTFPAKGKPPKTYLPATKATAKLVLTHPSLNSEEIPLLFYDSIQGESETLIHSNAPAIDPRLKLDRPHAITAIEIFKDTQISISSKDKTRTLIDSTQLSSPSPKLTTQSVITSQAVNNPQKLDITFVSSHFITESSFLAIAQPISEYFLTIAPFTDYSKSIHFRFVFTQQDLGCHYPGQNSPFIVCNNAQVLAEASAVPTDTIIVIENSQTYGGTAIIGGNIAVTYADISQLARQVAIHEFGHSFGSLMDEYGYGYVDYGTPFSLNCSRHVTCPIWNGIPSTGCFQTCSASNFYRSTYNDSLMRTLTPASGATFGFVGEELIRRRFESLGISPNNQVSPPSWWSCDADTNGQIDFLDSKFLYPRFNTLHLTTDCLHNEQTDIFDLNQLFTQAAL